MSGFKKFNRQDVFITSYTSKKEWTITSDSFENFGIRKLKGISGVLPIYSGSADFDNRIVYESIKHLYYSNNVETIQAVVRPVVITPTPTPSPTPSPTPTPTPSPTPTETPVPTPTITPTITPTPTPTPDIQIIDYNVVLLGGD